MNCVECKTDEFEFNERLGENVCVNCGYVLVEEIFEKNYRSYQYKNGELTRREPAKHGLGSLIGLNSDNDNKKLVRRLKQMEYKSKDRTHKRSIDYLLAIAAEFHPTQMVKEELQNNYMTLVRSYVLQGFNLDERIAAVIFFTFRANNRAIKLRELAKSCDAKINRVSKLARKIARHFERPWVLSQIDYHGEFERFGLVLEKGRPFIADCINVHLYLKPRCEDNSVVMNSAYVGAIIYITGILRGEKLTQKQICEVTNSPLTMSRYRQIRNLLGLKFKHLTVEEFINGAY